MRISVCGPAIQMLRRRVGASASSTAATLERNFPPPSVEKNEKKLRAPSFVSAQRSELLFVYFCSLGLCLFLYFLQIVLYSFSG